MELNAAADKIMDVVSVLDGMGRDTPVLRREYAQAESLLRTWWDDVKGDKATGLVQLTKWRALLVARANLADMGVWDWLTDPLTDVEIKESPEECVAFLADVDAALSQTGFVGLA